MAAELFCSRGPTWRLPRRSVSCGLRLANFEALNHLRKRVSFLTRARGISVTSVLLCAVLLFTVPNVAGLILSEESGNTLSSPGPGGLTLQPSVVRTNSQSDPAAGAPNRNAAPATDSISVESDASYFAVAIVLFFLVFSAFSVSVAVGFYGRNKTKIVTRRKVRSGDIRPGVVALEVPLPNTSPLIENGVPLLRSVAQDGTEARSGLGSRGPHPETVQAAIPHRRGVTDSPLARVPANTPFCRVVSPLSRRIR